MKQSAAFSFLRLALLLGWLVGLPAAAQLAGVLAPPANDNFADATEVAGVPLTLEADLAFATAEPFEAMPYLGYTAWWRWTAPADGIFEWDTAGSAGPVAVSVWGRDGFGQLMLRAYAPELLTSSNTVVALRRGSFPTRAGETLWLQASARLERWLGGVGAIDWDLGGPPYFPFGTNYPARITLQRSFTPAPANDHFAGRIPLTGTNATFTFQLDSASAEDGEPSLPGDSLQRTAWWTWRAPGNGTARLRSVGTNGAPVIGVYQTGTLFALQRLASSATEFGNECHREWRGRDVLDWDVVADGRYEIQMDRYPWNLPGTEFQLELTFTHAPANDDLANAQLIEGTDLKLTANNFGATRNQDDPVLPGRTGNGSVWFRWTAPTRGILQVTTNEPIRFAEPSFEILAPWGGFGWVRLQVDDPNPCGDPAADLKPLPPFVPVFGIYQVFGTNQGVVSLGVGHSGTNAAVAQIEGDVRIQLDGISDASGETTMNLLFLPPPANDSFVTRVVLPAAAVRVGGRTFAATVDTRDPFEGRTVWWEWKAPDSGTWALRPKSLAAYHRLGLWQGETPTPPPSVRFTEWAPLVFDAVAGETYQITAVAPTGTLGDNVGFELVPAVPPSLQLQRSRDWQAGFQFDTVSWPFGFDLPCVLETSTDLEHWTLTSLQSGWQFSTPVDQNEPRRFYRMRLVVE